LEATLNVYLKINESKWLVSFLLGLLVCFL
jgi:hypothetical protein